MSTFMAEAAAETAAAARKPSPAWLREPLLHFFVLGALLFGIDHYFASREDDPHVIHIDAQVDAHAIQVFKDARGREPNEQELFALRRVWLDNEVLYREGVSMGLDRGDASIRERVIFKALSIVDAGVKLAPADEKGLREFFDQNRGRYDDPARLDFEEAVLTGERTESAARSLAATLNAGGAGEFEADLRVFNARPRDNVVQSYGEEFAAGLEGATPGEWRVLKSKEGMRVVRLKALSPAVPGDFDDLRGVILQDWTDFSMSAKRSEAVKALAAKYTVKVTGQP